MRVESIAPLGQRNARKWQYKKCSENLKGNHFRESFIDVATIPIFYSEELERVPECK